MKTVGKACGPNRLETNFTPTKTEYDQTRLPQLVQNRVCEPSKSGIPSRYRTCDGAPVYRRLLALQEPSRPGPVT